MSNIARQTRADAVGEVYRLVLWYHRDELRQGNEKKRQRIFAASEVLRELFPAEIALWEASLDSRIASSGEKEE